MCILHRPGEDLAPILRIPKHQAVVVMNGQNKDTVRMPQRSGQLGSACILGGYLGIAPNCTRRYFILEVLLSDILFEGESDGPFGISDQNLANIPRRKGQRKDWAQSRPGIALGPEIRYSKWCQGLPIQVVGNNVPCQERLAQIFIRSASYHSPFCRPMKA